MSSFVDDNVSESKKEEQQIAENLENQTNSTETVTELTTKNSQTENITIPTQTTSNIDNINKKLNETKNKNIKTINENKNEKFEATAKAAATATATLRVFENNESNIDFVVIAAIDEDKNKGKKPITVAIDNNQNLNKTDDHKLVTAQINTSTVTVDLSAAACRVSTMTPGDFEQQPQKKQQQVSTFDNQQITANSVINRSNNEECKTNQKLTSSLLSTEHDKSEASKCEINDNDVKPSSIVLFDTKTAETKNLHLPPLPTGLTSFDSDSHLPHISSEPTFGVQLRQSNLEDQKYKTNNNSSLLKASSSASSARDWRPATSGLNFSSVIKSGTVSASASPRMVRKSSDSSVLFPRRVSFPKSDNELVTGYLEPANPWEHVYMVKSISEIAELYIASCQKHNTKPLQSILDHLKAVDLTKQLRRQPLLSLKSIKLAPSDCEALEEVLKRVQYKTIDLSDCKLDETAASALFDMIEYYEATHELDISSNAMGMTHRGWTSCIYMISHSQELQVLNAEGNPISKLSADHLGSALSTSNLHTLKLEHCGLKGAPLSGLCFKLWQNKVLKELWLAYNDLDCNDADTIAEMLKCNHYLEFIDISNNNVRDEGLRHIVKALIMQSKELERRTTFHRTAAIDDDGDCISPIESSSPSVDFAGENDDASLDWHTKNQEINENQSLKTTAKCSDLTSEISLCKEPSILPSIEEKAKELEVEVETGSGMIVECEQHKVKPPLISSVGSTIDENDGDEDTDDTVRSSTTRNPLQSTSGGQSMLDKLLSMNSESSSEDGASNLSTDTLAACNSEDASLMSEEIFDSAAITTTTTTSTNTKAPTNASLKVTLLSEDAETLTSFIENSSAKATLSSQTLNAGKDETTIQEDSPLECSFIERNKIKLNDTGIALDSSPTNLDKPLNIQSSHVIHNNNNNNNPTIKPFNMPLTPTEASNVPSFSNNDEEQQFARTDVFEVTAEDSDCLLNRGVSRLVVGDDINMSQGDHASVMQHHVASRALDVNKNTKLGEEFDDTHSTDSAFESASEGDISRHLPEEFTRLSTSLESSRFDDIAKELAIETATIASESNECLIAAAAQITPSSTPTPPTPLLSNLSTPFTEREQLSAESPITCLSSSLPPVTTTTSSTVKVGFDVSEEPTDSLISTTNEVRDKMPKVTIAQESFIQKYKSNSAIRTSPSPIPTPPPPSTSPGGASSSLRRTESSCGLLTQSSRNRSQSTESLCSDNSLDGSIGSGDLNFLSSSQLNDKITKNDTLTRQQRPSEATSEFCTRTPGGLKALAVWNNSLTKESGYYISDLLAESVSLELLNIGKNCLSNEFITMVKESLTKNTTLTTLGLQSAHLSAKGIETLSSILTFGGNSTLQRIDIRDNKLEVESLTKIAEVLKSNTTVTQIDIDDEPKRLSVGSEAHMDYARVLENVRSMCSRNEKTQAQIQQEKSTPNFVGKKRGGYYLGSRKISLTCQSRPIMDTSKTVVAATVPNSKLDIKRKASTRLRSPVPSPTAISPSSSPNRSSRFQVFRVPEASPLTSPCTQKPIGGENLVAAKAVSMSTAALSLSSATSKESNNIIYPSLTSTSLPTSCSMPSMATISSSTQSIKRLSISPRSRFLVRKVYEDPNLPLGSCFTQAIASSINPPPDPISQDAQTSANLLTQSKTCNDVLRQDSLSISCRATESISAKVTPSKTYVTLPTIITSQQVNTTTDNTSTGVLKLNENISATPRTEEIVKKQVSPEIKNLKKQCEQSTNNAIINEKDITNQTQTTTTEQTATSPPLSNILVTVSKCSTSLQPSPSILPTLPALLSSPESTSSSSSSSSSSSTSPASNADSSDSSSSSVTSVHSNEVLSQEQQCPIAVFSDNDITLTKNTVNEVFGPVAAAAAAAAVNESFVNTIETPNENVDPPTAKQLENQQQRVRKISWISNPTAVDKLLTLFHNSTTIFQRSSSPETKPVATWTTTIADVQSNQSSPTHEEIVPAAAVLAVQQQKSQASLVPTRKHSPPSWTKLGNDIITAAATNNLDLANSAATTAAAVVTEQSRSFFDAASKQFRDLSKQVFRQNLSFGNEPVTTASTSNTQMTTVSAFNVQPTACEVTGRTRDCCSCGCVGTTTGCLCGNTPTTEYNANCLPTEIKKEIKENISPEHTINEETLHKMQKLNSSSAALTSAITTIPAINLDTNNDDKNDWIKAKESSTTTISMFSAFPAAASVGVATAAAAAGLPTLTPPPPTSTQIQHSTVAEISGIESDRQAHNT